MKKLLAIFLLVAQSIFAQHITDNANLLNGQTQQLETSLSSSHVWVETFTQPPGDLKTYADNQIPRLSSGRDGVLIVITTQPRAWRISMYPIGLINQSTVQLAGQALVNGLRAGTPFSAFKNAADILNSAIDNRNAAPAQAAPAISVQETQTYTPHPNSSADIIFYAVVIIVGMLIVFVVLEVVLGKKKKKQLEQERVKSQKNTPKTTPKKITPILPKSVPVSPTASEKRKAKKLFDSYTPSERRTIINQYSNSPYYYSGCHNNDWLFYYILFSNNGLNILGHSDTPVSKPAEVSYSDPAPVHHKSYDDDSYRSSSSSSSSSSDDSGGGGSWGGSSDFSSSFSSDSSGGGGSW